MDKLVLKKGNKIFWGEVEVNRNSVDMAEFLVANLNTPVEIENGLLIEELVHFFYDCKDFIYILFSEKYEVLRALITIKNLKHSYSYIKIYNKIHLDEDYVYIHPSIDFIIESNEKLRKINNLSALPVILEEQTQLFEDDFFNFLEPKEIKKQYKTVLTLQDIMRAIFEDLTYYLKEDIAKF